MTNIKLMHDLIESSKNIISCEQVNMPEQLIEQTVLECIRVINDCVNRYQPASTYSAELAQHFGIDQIK